MPTEYSAPAAACAADLLELLALSPGPLTLAEIARQLDRTKSLMFRVAKELETREFIQETSEGRLWLGTEILELGGSNIYRNPSAPTPPGESSKSSRTRPGKPSTWEPCEVQRCCTSNNGKLPTRW
ncbi:MAG: helix-turn-helix domain-containing protein [Acidimicrobiia bacterium]